MGAPILAMLLATRSSAGQENAERRKYKAEIHKSFTRTHACE